MTDLTPRLGELGDAIERAAARDLASGARRSRRRPSRRRMAVVAVALLLLPATAVAAVELIGEDDVARSLPAGTLSLAGTEPTCTTVKANVEYDCMLARAPRPEVSDWKGTVEPTVDATKHVNGGCRSLTSDGTRWRCYIGRAAVEQRIIDAGFLGEPAPAPGRG